MQKSFRTKLIQMVLASVIGVSLIVILLTTVNYVAAHIKNERELAKKQTEIICNALEQELEALYQLGSMMQKDSSVKEYMETQAATEDGPFLNEMAMRLTNYRKLNPNISTVSLVRYLDEKVYYAGHKWQADRQGLYEKMKSAYLNAAETGEEVKLLVGESAFTDQGSVLELFFPVYHSYSVYKETGFVCITISEEVLREYYEGDFFDHIVLTDRNGKIVSQTKSEKQNAPSIRAEDLKDGEKLWYQGGIYYVTAPVKAANWYVVAEISLARILKSAAGMLGISLLFMAAMCATLVFVCYKEAQKLIHPVEDLKERMGRVAQGDMTIRMDIPYQETEFNEMAGSFNVMVKNVDRLMEKIKEEQQQMQKIQLSALQEQIKPHFLYNTLECIHMQAIIDGNEEIARLVMALASYYRLSLGKGQDVVTLKQELSHIENYLIIQNVRYGNIIALDNQIPEEYYSLPMLKMTLQPLVENCIYHGIKVKEGKGGTVTLGFSLEKDTAVLRVKDDGAGMTEEQVLELNEAIQSYDEKKGYGVRNVNRRIRIFFGEVYGLKYVKNEDAGITVEIRIPVKR